jgi:PAS domain S-box-containing protein
MAISALLAALVFALDVSTPLGVAFGVPYVAVVLVGLWLPGIWGLYVLAGLGSLLTVAGYFLSAPEGVSWMVLSNRGLAPFAIWVTAIICSQRKSAVKEIVRTREQLENRVEERTRELRQEISKRKSREATLRQSEMTLRSAIDYLPSLFYHRDKEGRYTLTNKVYEKAYALKPGEAIGETPYHHISTKVANAYLASDREVIETGQSTRKEMTATRGDGIPRILRVVKYPVRNAEGDISGVGAISTDITDLKKAEEALRESEAMFRSIFEDTAVATAFGEAIGEVSLVNRAMCRLFGYSEQELLNMSLLDITHPDDRAQAVTRGQQSLASRTSPYQIEKRYIRRDGKTIWVHLVVTPVYGPEGVPVYTIRQYQDITERKRAEEALVAAKEEAELANRVKTDFLASISHELRTPLNAIIGFSEMIRQETLGPIGNKRYVEYVGDIHFSGQHLLGIVNDILDISAIECGTLNLKEDTLDVGRVVDSSLRMIISRAKTQAVKIGSSVDPELPNLVADELKFKQILLNLLSNAVKFTSQGGKVSLGARTEDDGSMAIAVSDTGIGMDHDGLAVAMSKFGQVDSGLNRSHQGTGLGLPLVKGLMEAHGGSLELRSEKGVGTTATIRFPKERVRVGSF